MLLKCIKITAVILLCFLTSGWRQGFQPTRSQVNFNFINIGGEWPFLNWVKRGTNIFNCDGTATIDIANLDSNGYQLTLENGGICTNTAVPSQQFLAGNYVFIWQGTGRVRASFSGLSTVFNSSTTSPWIVSLPSSAPGTLSVPSNQLGFDQVTSGDHPHNLAMVWVGTCNGTTIPLQTNNNCGDYDDFVAGKYYRSAFINAIKNVKFGTLRFLNWNGLVDAGANYTNVVTWEQRKPLGYIVWGGDEIRGTTYGGATTYNLSTTDDYSLTCISGSDCFGQSPTDKMMITVQFNSNAATNSWTFNLNGTGALPMVEPSQSAGDTSHRPLSGKYATLVFDADLQVWMEFGGDTTHQNVFIASGAPFEAEIELCNEVKADCWFIEPPLSADPQSDFATGLAQYAQSNLSPGLKFILEGPNEEWNPTFYVNGYATNKCMVHWNNSATPWSSTVTYSIGQFVTDNDGNTYESAINSNLNNKPSTHTPSDWTLIGQTPVCDYEWYGKILSTLGQAVANVYGIGNLGKTYEVHGGIKTADMEDATTRTRALIRFNSPLYVAQSAPPQSPYTKTAAYNWSSNWDMANYWNPGNNNTAFETIETFQYLAGNPAGLNAYFNSFYTGRFGLNNVKTLAQSSVTQASSLTVPQTVTFYEGGYSPDYSVNDHVNPVITGATNATSAVLSLGIENDICDKDGITCPYQWDGVVGMSLHFTKVNNTTVWNINTTYSTSALVVASDNNIYQSLSNGNVGNNPVTDGGIHWQNNGSAAGSWEGLLLTPTEFVVTAADIFAHTMTVNINSSGFSDSLTGSTSTPNIDGIIAPITGITSAKPCVITVDPTPLATFPMQGITSSTPLASSENLTINSLSGVSPSNFNMSYTVFSVSGNNITTTQDCSAFTSYVSGGTVTISASALINAFRGAPKMDNRLSQYIGVNYNFMLQAGASRPSLFQFGGHGDAWSAIDPDISLTTAPELTAIAGFNGGHFP